MFYRELLHTPHWYSTGCQRQSTTPCNCTFSMNHLNHRHPLTTSSDLTLLCTQVQSSRPGLQLHAGNSKKICMSYFIHTHVAHIVSFTLKMTLPTNYWSPVGGCHSFDTDEFLPMGYNYGRGIYEKFSSD